MNSLFERNLINEDVYSLTWEKQFLKPLCKKMAEELDSSVLIHKHGWEAKLDEFPVRIDLVTDLYRVWIVPSIDSLFFDELHYSPEYGFDDGRYIDMIELYADFEPNETFRTPLVFEDKILTHEREVVNLRFQPERSAEYFTSGKYLDKYNEFIDRIEASNHVQGMRK